MRQNENADGLKKAQAIFFRFGMFCAKKMQKGQTLFRVCPLSNSNWLLGFKPEPYMH